MEKAYLITQNTDLKNNFSEYERLYIGDQYCEHNMFYFFDDIDFIKQIITLNKKITITTPILSEKGLKKFFLFLNFFMKKNIKKKDLEIVVNEHGTFYKLVNDYPNIKIVWGNFLSGQNKDPYLMDFKDKEKHKNLSIDSKYYTNLFNKNKIDRIELYNVFQGVNIKENFNINLYYPYTVYSINRYCINALIYKNIDYMIIVEDCIGCQSIESNDLDMSLDIGNEKINQYFRGNKQFYGNIILVENININRIIYNYDLLKNTSQ